MTQTIDQVTDFSAIEDAIELWAATGSGLPQLQDDDAFDLPKMHWAGYDIQRKRPYGLIQIIADRSPGGSCKTRGLVSGEYVTTFSKAFNWICQITFFQDSYDDDGAAIRETAQKYAKSLVDSYDLPPVSNILISAGIGFNPVNRNITGDVLPNTDDDKYIHRASVDVMFNGINTKQVRDTDYFTDIADPFIDMFLTELQTESGLTLMTEAGQAILIDYGP